MDMTDVRKELDLIWTKIGGKPTDPIPVDPPIIPPAPPVLQPLFPDVGITSVPIYDRPWITYMGRGDDWLADRFWYALQVISEYIAAKYPDRLAPKMEIICGCPPQGSPARGAHGEEGLWADLHYYTQGRLEDYPFSKPSNHTQFSSLTERRVEIWTDGQLNKMFDPERNLLVMESIRKPFPQARILTVTPIIRALGAEKLTWITDACAPGFDHETHMHVSCGKVFNEQAVL
jgi:hypothetical protein